MDDLDYTECKFKACKVHDSIVTKIRLLFWFLGTILVVTLACAAISFAAQIEASNSRHDLDVHVAGQDQRMKNIEAALKRIEASVHNIEKGDDK